MEQKYSSKDTSINTVNKVYKSYDFPENSLILDYGGGKYDSNKKYMCDKNNSKVVIYDKYNREIEHNNNVLEYCKQNVPDFIVCSNVLNVIMEDEIIDYICRDISDYCRENTIIIFSIYECDKSGIGKVTTKGYQRNQRTCDYLSFIKKYFDVKTVKNCLIICKKKEDL